MYLVWLDLNVRNWPCFVSGWKSGTHAHVYMLIISWPEDEIWHAHLA